MVGITIPTTNGNKKVISLTSYNVSNKIPFAKNPPVQKADSKELLAAAAAQDEKLKQQADEQMKEGYFDNAINLYKQALLINSENPDANLSLAKTYKLKSDYKNALPYFEKSTSLFPEDLEVATLLGECYKHTGQYKKAEDQFQKIVNKDPQYDYAKRNLLDTKNLMIACYDPTRAYKERQTAAQDNLNTAINMAADFFPKGYMKDMGDLTIAFDKTEQMAGRSNIAQYEDKKRKVAVIDEYVYASPKLVATYVVHELVHAKDKDPYTSIKEEQDAFRIQADFWIKNVKDVKDPEMDYVIELYKKSPETLDKRVAEIYRLRDKDIPETSPNHPPSKGRAAANSLTNGQPIRAYDIIV